MNIVLNGEAVEFSLGKENSLQEILLSLTTFLNQHHHMLKSVAVDGKVLDLEIETELSTPLSAIKALSIESQSIIESISETIPTLNLLIDTLMNLKSEDNLSHEKKKEVIENLKWAVDGTITIAEALHIPTKYVLSHYKDLGELLAHLKVLNERLLSDIHDNKTFNTILTENVQPQLTILREFMIPLMVDFYNFFVVMNKDSLKSQVQELLTRLMKPVAENLEEFLKVTTFLQEGKTSKGVHYIHQAILTYELLVMIANHLSKIGIVTEQSSIESLKKDIDANVQEITQALTHNDIVTICDLMEYEYFPKVQELTDFLKKSGA